ncbi:MAG: efflux RND transporter periplasmic adaptor subunit [Isosphaeraceae bacterium]|nr:efflux RND transporter periplasmic adaptor subunit [Isosphaeraceae bacterium]
MARVDVVRPERHTVRRTVSEPAQLQAFETTEMHAKIAGFIKSWNVNIGAIVKKGQVLAELSVPELEAESQQKKAEIEQAISQHKLASAAAEVAQANVTGAEAKLLEVRAGVKRVSADLARWQSEFKRVEELFRARAQTGSLVDETRSKLHSAEAAGEEIAAQVRTAEVTLIQARAAFDQARANVAAAASATEVAREEAHRVEALLAYTKIEAPFDGIVTRRHIDTGQLTKPSADSEPLFVLARSDMLTITTDVPELFAAEVNPGDHVTVELQAMKGNMFEGTITRTAWALDPKTRTLRVEIDLPNPNAKLRPGLYAYATVIAEEHANVLTVPSTAPIREKDKATCVIVVDGKAVRRAVELGLNDGTRTEVVSGLTKDDTVVKANAASLVDGQPLESLPPTPPAKP